MDVVFSLISLSLALSDSNQSKSQVNAIAFLVSPPLNECTRMSLRGGWFYGSGMPAAFQFPTRSESTVYCLDLCSALSSSLALPRRMMTMMMMKEDAGSGINERKECKSLGLMMDLGQRQPCWSDLTKDAEPIFVNMKGGKMVDFVVDEWPWRFALSYVALVTKTCMELLCHFFLYQITFLTIHVSSAFLTINSAWGIFTHSSKYRHLILLSFYDSPAHCS